MREHRSNSHNETHRAIEHHTRELKKAKAPHIRKHHAESLAKLSRHVAKGPEKESERRHSGKRGERRDERHSSSHRGRKRSRGGSMKGMDM